MKGHLTTATDGNIRGRLVSHFEGDMSVGSTVGVGLVEGKNGVNWKLLYSVFAGWIFTILICAVATGALFYVSMLFIQFCGVC